MGSAERCHAALHERSPCRVSRGGRKDLLPYGNSGFAVAGTRKRKPIEKPRAWMSRCRIFGALEREFGRGRETTGMINKCVPKADP